MVVETGDDGDGVGQDLPSEGWGGVLQCRSGKPMAWLDLDWRLTVQQASTDHDKLKRQGLTIVHLLTQW